MTSHLRRTLAGFACASLLLPAAACTGSGGKEAKDPAHPDAWDTRVVPYVELAAKLRGLDFEHPVTVEFQTEVAFEKGIKADEGDLDAEDREDLENYTGMLRAMGLIHGDVDLFDEQEKLTASGTLAYYSYEDKLIRVRGTEITPAVKSTLVHELVHVLQDQNFDMGKRSEELAEIEDSSALVYDALVEGDASRIQTKYADQLSSKELAALERDEERQLDAAESSIKDVPEVLQVMMESPYALGEALLEIATLDGEEAVDELFRTPPSTEENLLDPFTLTEDEDDARKVKKPALAKGQKEFDTNTFESTGWLLLLAARLPLGDVVTATDGWGGDRYVAYTEDDRACVKVQYVGDTARDTTEMQRALTSWIAAGTPGAASVKKSGKGLLFTSCDPGTAATGQEHSQEALEVALSRTYIAQGLIQDQTPTEEARCYATKLVTHLSLDEIMSDDPSAAVIARFRELAAECNLA